MHTTASDYEEPRQKALSRNRGTERSIGVELGKVSHTRSRSLVTGRSHGASNTHIVLTQKDYNEIYSLRYAKGTIVLFALLLSLALAVFAVALSSIGTLEVMLSYGPVLPFLSIGLTLLWALWYCWDIIDLMFIVCQGSWQQGSTKTWFGIQDETRGKKSSCRQNYYYVQTATALKRNQNSSKTTIDTRP